MGRRVHFARDGQEVMDYLQRSPPFNDRGVHPLPNLLLLDLKMPRVDGFELLEWLRRQPIHSMLRAVVLSASDEPRDIARAYALGASSYHVKPADFEGLARLIGSIVGYWSDKVVSLEADADTASPKPRSMRILLHNIKTGQFFQNAERWTDNPKEALDFERCDRALGLACGAKLQDVEVFYDLKTGAVI